MGGAAWILGFAWVVASNSPATQRTIEGHVFVDTDGDGLFSEHDTPIPGVHVAFNNLPFVKTDEAGRYALQAPSLTGEVWVRIPDGYSPMARFASVQAAGDVTADFALQPESGPRPLTFVVMADPHIGKQEYGGKGHFDASALSLGLNQALVGLDPAPSFFVIAGDITNREGEEEIREVQNVLADVDVPFVPIPGNHDWTDGGAMYRKHFGPPNYSFDAGGTHFVVLNDNPQKNPDVTFLARDLALVPDDRLVVVFMHRPPNHRVLDLLADAGVDYLFTGHWHSNRYAEHGALTQINTEAIIRGGLDFTPAGYRIVTIEGSEVAIAHHTVVERPVVAITWPADDCVAEVPLRVLAAVETGAAPVEVTATVDSRSVSMSPSGGWSYSATFDVPTPGDHHVRVTARNRTGLLESAERSFRTCTPLPVPTLAAWPQFQGGPEHDGRATASIEPPLRALWIADLGQHLLGGSPTVSDGRLFVALADLDDGDGGGVVALDAATGKELWRYVTGHSVRGAPAVAQDTVVIAANDGTLHALNARTGARLWKHDLGARVEDKRSAMLAAPTIADGVVYAGVVGRFAAVDLAAGKVLWGNTPAPTMKNHASNSAVTVVDDLVVGAFGLGGDGVVAWDTKTGTERWRLSEQVSGGVHASPVHDGDTLYIINSSAHLSAISTADGALTWQRKLHEGGTPLSMAVAGSPALHEDLLIVPTQYESIIAFDLKKRKVAWSSPTATANIHVAHNKRVSNAVTASPVITGDIVWAGSADGTLRALRSATGEVLWETDLGVPILSAPTPAGDVLFVATFDGTVRALVSPQSRKRDSRLPLWLVLGGCALVVIGFALRRRGSAGP